jgi:hypothetical protein
MHFNCLRCYLFHRVSLVKGMNTFSIVQSKNMTISALLGRVFPAIKSNNNKTSLFITTKTVAYIFALVINSLTIFQQDSPHSSALQHKASILEELNSMPPNEFCTELCESLTTLYNKILKLPGIYASSCGQGLLSQVHKKSCIQGRARAGRQLPPPLNHSGLWMGHCCHCRHRPAAAAAPRPPSKAAPATRGCKGTSTGRGGKSS